ncbi:HNH endonuclease [Bacillus subtilis]|uniref:HNH endonuclease n=1 Tax=Bacillus subtilis TaxID=1423 RepID=UPI003D1686A3
MAIKYNKNKLRPLLELLDSGYLFYKDGRVWRNYKKLNQFKTIKLDKPEIASTTTTRGYRRIGHKNEMVYEHTLIYAWFHGIDVLDSFQCIDHINGNKSDNRIENLEGVTIRENSRRAESLGLVKRTFGEVNGMHKLKSENIKEIFELRQQGLTQYEIAAKFSVTQGHISEILSGKKRRVG